MHIKQQNFFTMSSTTPSNYIIITDINQLQSPFNLAQCLKSVITILRKCKDILCLY